MTDYSHRPHWLAYSTTLSPLLQPTILWTEEDVDRYRTSGWDVTGPYGLDKAARTDTDERHAE